MHKEWLFLFWNRRIYKSRGGGRCYENSTAPPCTGLSFFLPEIFNFIGSLHLLFLKMLRVFFVDYFYSIFVLNRWVEMMAPVFSRAAWRCVWYMIQVTINYYIKCCPFLFFFSFTYCHYLCRMI